MKYNCIQGIFHMPPWPNFPLGLATIRNFPATELSLLCHNDESVRTLRLRTTSLNKTMFFLQVFVVFRRIFPRKLSNPKNAWALSEFQPWSQEGQTVLPAVSRAFGQIWPLGSDHWCFPNEIEVMTW